MTGRYLFCSSGTSRCPGLSLPTVVCLGSVVPAPCLPRHYSRRPGARRKALGIVVSSCPPFHVNRSSRVWAGPEGPWVRRHPLVGGPGPSEGLVGPVHGVEGRYPWKPGVYLCPELLSGGRTSGPGQEVTTLHLDVVLGEPGFGSRPVYPRVDVCRSVYRRGPL